MVGVFGLNGELKVSPSRIGEDVLAVGVALRAAWPNGESRALRVRALRRHQGRPLVAFDGVEDANAAEALSGAVLWVDRDAVTLASDEYFDDDLVGCSLIGPDGAVLGEVAAVEHYPAQDVLVLRQAQDRNARALVPLVGAFVKRIDLGAKQIHVDLPPGLIDARKAEEA